MSETKSEPKETIHLLLIGRYKHSKGKKSWLWHRIDPEMNDGRAFVPVKGKEAIFSGKPICPGIQPGGIITIDATPNTMTVSPSTARPFGIWQNEEDVVRWRAEDRVTTAEIEDEGEALKAIKEKLPVERLAPFRRAYQNMTARQQAHLLAWVIHEITRFRPET